MRVKPYFLVFTILVSILMVAASAYPIEMQKLEDTSPDPEPSGLAADPVRVEFQAEDGKNLVGYYYPSKYANSPVIVLMHWAGGDQRDWCQIAPWLQNRLDESPALMEGCPEPPGSHPIWDPSWFPMMLEGTSYAVFTFDFRDYGESDRGLGTPSNWNLDGVAAYQIAASMEATMLEQARLSSGNKLAAPSLAASSQSILPVIVVGGGSSIGADVPVVACELINLAMAELVKCIGAFSWSPGSYTGVVYAEVVKRLAEMDPPIPSWCLAGANDGESAPTCKSAEEDLDLIHLYEGSSDHGNGLMTPEYDPTSLSLFQEFLGLTIGPAPEE